MNIYFQQYKDLIRMARNRQKDIPLWYKEQDIYTENHHIIPKCIGKLKNREKLYDETWNRVRLTAKEHFIAHEFLYKGYLEKYGERNIYTIKMAYAWTSMGFTNNSDVKITAKDYKRDNIVQATSKSFRYYKDNGKIDIFTGMRTYSKLFGYDRNGIMKVKLGKQSIHQDIIKVVEVPNYKFLTNEKFIIKNPIIVSIVHNERKVIQSKAIVKHRVERISKNWGITSTIFGYIEVKNLKEWCRQNPNYSIDMINYAKKHNIQYKDIIKVEKLN